MKQYKQQVKMGSTHFFNSPYNSEGVRVNLVMMVFQLCFSMVDRTNNPHFNVLKDGMGAKASSD